MSVPGITCNPLVLTITLALRAFRPGTCTVPHPLTSHFYLWLLVVRVQQLPFQRRSFAKKVMWLIFLPNVSRHIGGRRTFSILKCVLPFVSTYRKPLKNSKWNILSILFFPWSKIIRLCLTYPISWSPAKSVHLSSYVINILALAYSGVRSQLSRILKCQWPVGHCITF